MTQSINEQIGAFPAIESESHLIQVGLEMFGADFVPRSYDAALQQRESRLRCVCVNVAIDVYLVLVLDSFVFRAMYASFDHRLRVCSPFVGHDDIDIGAHVFLDVLCERAGLNIARMEESQIAAALADANDNFLVVVLASMPTTSVLPAYKGFVHFDGTVKHGLIYFFHGSTDAMAQVPSCLVGAFVLPPDRTLQLTGAHAFLGLTEQQDGHEPEWQRQMGVVEDGSRSDGELITAFAACELFAGINPPHVPIFAAGTLNTFGPTEFSKNFSAVFIGRKRMIQLRECHDRTSQEEKAQNRKAA